MKTKTEKFDEVNRPAHYTEGRNYEPIDVIEDWGLGFNLGNALKYIARCGRKDDAVKDLQKAQFYINREISKLSGTIPQEAEQKEKWVDLGLSVLWATTNVGADVPTDDGNYFNFDEAQELGMVPTKEQFKELMCLPHEWDEEKKCMVFRGNGNELLLPAAGYCYGSSFNHQGTYGLYWSATQGYSSNAYYLFFYSSYLYMYDDNKTIGLTVRLVKNK